MVIARARCQERTSDASSRQRQDSCFSEVDWDGGKGGRMFVREVLSEIYEACR